MRTSISAKRPGAPGAKIRSAKRPAAPGARIKAAAAAPVAQKRAARKLPQQRPLTAFERAVARAIGMVPRGQTRGYGEIALRAGKPRGARAVARALHNLDDVTWWRVARSDGTFAPQVARLQESLLRQEGWTPKRRRR